MFLLIDWGNSLLKFLEVERLNMTSLSQNKLRTVDNIEQLDKILGQHYQAILISSVRNKSDNLALNALLNIRSDNIFWAKTQPQACGVKCAYKAYQDLGIDRWLGVLAADQYASSAAVISIGSAITFDVINQHHHIGGQIVPGLRLLLSSLSQTGQVRASEAFANEASFQLGKSTSACVHQGIESLIQSYVSTLIKQSKNQYRVDKIIFCGGGGEYWSQFFTAESELVCYSPRLIFEGLIRLYGVSNKAYS